MFIGLTGYKSAGKDTFAVELADYGFRRYAFADKLKSIALAIDPTVQMHDGHYAHLSDAVAIRGWDEAKGLPDVRRILQRLGKEAVRDQLGADTWIRALDRSIADYTGDVVITDVRFLNEAAYVRRRGGVIWRIVRQGVKNTDPHPSENELLQIDADVVIQNTTRDAIPTSVKVALERSRHGAANRGFQRAAS